MEFFDAGETTEEELDAAYERAVEVVDDVEFRSTLNQPEDQLSCILEINAGAGGTESCDWSDMLLRMYIMWGEKNGKHEWAARVRQLAAEQKVPETFFTADEEYGTWVDIPGLGTYSHTSDLVAPAGADIGPPLGTRAAPPAPVSWPEFRTRRLAPLE